MITKLLMLRKAIAEAPDEISLRRLETELYRLAWETINGNMAMPENAVGIFGKECKAIKS